MFNKDDLKRFFENTSASRREFFEYLSKMSLVAMASSLNLSLSEEGQAENVGYGGGNLFDITDLMNDQCLFCYPVGVCVRILSHHKVCIAPIVSYKIPVGFAETGDAGQFGKSSDELSFLSEDYSYLKNDLNLGNGAKPYIPPGTRYGQVGQGQAKMQLYPHYYGLSPTMIQQVQREMAKVNKLNKACTPCLPNVLAEVATVNTNQVQLPPVVSTIAENYISQMYAKYKGHSKKHKDGPSKEFIQKFYGNQQLADQVYNNLQYVYEHFYQLSRDLSSAYASNKIPSVPSELFAFIWAFQELSPDEEKWQNIIMALQQAMKQGQIQSYELACPYMASLIVQNPEIAQAFASSGFDPSFVCVGLWGNGYPRVADVETVDPIVGGLLSIARWHHLISTTIKVGERPLVATPPQASWYQLYNPYIGLVGKRCFQPGWAFSDITENTFNKLICAESPDIISAMQPNSPSASAIQLYFQDPYLMNAVANYAVNLVESIACALGGIGGGFSLSGMAEGINPFNKKYRNVGVIVYQQHQKCCCPPVG
jgi:hypothetical protein